MKWLPWLRKSNVDVPDVEVARKALDESAATGVHVHKLARELEHIREQNNFSLRLKLALQAGRDDDQ